MTKQPDRMLRRSEEKVSGTADQPLGLTKGCPAAPRDADPMGWVPAKRDCAYAQYTPALSHNTAPAG
ncbi:hypothetical protein A0H81_13058 [Grifola frondosa]|uniref:Uncharacterized protein n=1 Tax=Grifola frondosa TaxID=5627 RepID=A0A1C7LR47_GRIFR|nr:hypothetical protein A0H81_13058 [Grifola frondosa]